MSKSQECLNGIEYQPRAKYFSVLAIGEKCCSHRATADIDIDRLLRVRLAIVTDRLGQMRVNMKGFAALGLAALFLIGCTSGTSEDAAQNCDQTIIEADPSLGPMEARASSSSTDLEGWALFFPTWGDVEPGTPMVLPVDAEIKIVWKVTGEGDDFRFRAVASDGTEAPLVWGPQRQGGNWDRPGDERGTGWLLPEPGCWTLELRRGDATHTLVALADPSLVVVVP